MRELIRKWLGVTKADLDISRIQEVVYAPTHQNKPTIDFDARVKQSIDSLLSIHNMCDEIAILQQKVDAVADAIGVDVAADVSTGAGVAVIVAQEGKLTEARELFAHVIATKELARIHAESMREMLRVSEAFRRSQQK